MSLIRSTNILFGFFENDHIHNVILLLLNFVKLDAENDQRVKMIDRITLAVFGAIDGDGDPPIAIA